MKNKRLALLRKFNSGGYIVKSGDSLSRIAKNNNITLEDLLKNNPNIKDQSLIHIGDKINIPQKKEYKLPKFNEYNNYVEDTSPQPGTTRLPILNFNKKNNLSTKEDETDSQDNIYSIKAGDNLYSIAKDNNLTLSELLKINPDIKNPSLINIGQKINLPSKETNTVMYRPMYRKMGDIYSNEDNYINEDAITRYGKHNGNYVIIDKKGSELKVYNKNNELLKTLPMVGSGRSGKDYNSRVYVDASGNLIDGTGNFSTPAGPSKIKSRTMYHGSPAFQRTQYNPSTGEYDFDTPSSFHLGFNPGSHACVRLSDGTLKCLDEYVTPGETMVYTLPETDDTKFTLRDGNLNYHTPGNVEYTDISDENKAALERGLLKRYTDNENIKDGKERFMQDHTQVLDKKSANDLIIRRNDNFKPEDDEYIENADRYANTLITNKESLQRKLNIDSKLYNELAKIAMGIAEQESKFGTASRFKAKKFIHDSKQLVPTIKRSMMLDTPNAYKFFEDNGYFDEDNPDNDGMTFLKNRYNDVAAPVMRKRKVNPYNHSYGMNQIKIDGDNEELRKIYEDMGITKENIDMPEYSALATMAKLAHIYKYETNLNQTKGNAVPVSKLELLLYKYIGKHNLVRNKDMQPEDNKYIRNVKKYSDYYDYYTRVNELTDEDEYNKNVEDNKEKKGIVGYKRNFFSSNEPIYDYPAKSRVVANFKLGGSLNNKLINTNNIMQVKRRFGLEPIESFKRGGKSKKDYTTNHLLTKDQQDKKNKENVDKPIEKSNEYSKDNTYAKIGALLEAMRSPDDQPTVIDNTQPLIGSSSFGVQKVVVPKTNFTGIIPINAELNSDGRVANIIRPSHETIPILSSNVTKGGQQVIGFNKGGKIKKRFS